jgi:predicted nucleic acid-binding protein
MGIKSVFDTNILIDYLNGIREAAEEIVLYDQKMISVITWMEVLVGAKAEEEEIIRSFLDSFTQCGLGAEVAEAGVALRQRYKLKLPDAIIYATARTEGCLLVTRNTADFNPELPDIRVPYRL